MLETLYKNKHRADLQPIDAEAFELILDQTGSGLDQRFRVREIHGFWDDENKRFIHQMTTFCDEEGFPSFAKAHERYIEQRQYRVKTGFCHSYSIDYFGDGPYVYKLLLIGDATE